MIVPTQDAGIVARLKSFGGAVPSAAISYIIRRAAPGPLASKLSEIVDAYPAWLALVDRSILVPTPFGFSIWCDRSEHIGRSLVKTGQWEGLLSRTILACLGPGCVAIDIGSNIGYDTMLMSTAVGADGTVLSVEPDHRNLEYLLRNLHQLRHANVVVLSAGVGDCLGLANITLATDVNRGQSNLRPGAAGASQPLLVLRLDALVAESDRRRIGFVKIDVEGFEYKVIQGMGRLVDRVDVLTCEVVPAYLRQCGASADALFGTMREFGFTSFCAPSNFDGRWVPSGPDFRCGGSSLDQFDALFCRSVNPALASLIDGMG